MSKSATPLTIVDHLVVHNSISFSVSYQPEKTTLTSALHWKLFDRYYAESVTEGNQSSACNNNVYLQSAAKSIKQRMLPNHRSLEVSYQSTGVETGPLSTVSKEHAIILLLIILPNADRFSDSVVRL